MNPIVPTQHSGPLVSERGTATIRLEVIAPEGSWSDRVEQTRNRINVVKSTAHGLLAMQVMTGLDLLDLHKEYAKPGRRTDLTSPHDAERLSWKEFLEQQLGISDDTARRWMQMARAVKPRLGDMGANFRALPLLEMPLHLMTDEQQQLVEKAVTKITDGQTQIDFLRELGLAKKPQAAELTGGANGGTPSTEAPDPNAPVEVARDLVVIPLRKLLCLHWPQHWMHVTKAEMQELDGLLMEARQNLKAAMGGAQ